MGAMAGVFVLVERGVEGNAAGANADTPESDDKWQNSIIAKVNRAFAADRIDLESITLLNCR